MQNTQFSLQYTSAQIDAKQDIDKRLDETVWQKMGIWKEGFYQVLSSLSIFCDVS